MSRSYKYDDKHDEEYPTDDVYDQLCSECREYRPIEQFDRDDTMCQKCHKLQDEMEASLSNAKTVNSIFNSFFHKPDVTNEKRDKNSK